MVSDDMGWVKNVRSVGRN